MSYQQLNDAKEEIEQRRSDNMTEQHNKRIKETRNEIRFDKSICKIEYEI